MADQGPRRLCNLEQNTEAARTNVEATPDPRFMNDGEMIMVNTAAVKDPVCGMDVDTATAAGRSEYKGQTYYFCGTKCKEKFDLNPAQYVGAGTPKSGHGCCS